MVNSLFSRRTIISSLVTSSVFLPTTALAFSGCSSADRTGSPVLTTELLSGLSNSFWIPLGPQNRRTYCYAMIAPWCPNCQNLVLDAKAGRLPFSIRAVPVAAFDSQDRIRIFNLLRFGDHEAWSEFHSKKRPTIRKGTSSSEIDAIYAIQDRLFGALEDFSVGFLPERIRGTPVFAFKNRANTGADPAWMYQGYDGSTGRVVADLTDMMTEALDIENSNAIDVGEFLNSLQKTVFVDKRVWFGEDRDRLRVTPRSDGITAQCTSSSGSAMTIGFFVFENKLWHIVPTTGHSILFVQ